MLRRITSCYVWAWHEWQDAPARPATHAMPIRSRFGTAIGSPVLIDSIQHRHIFIVVESHEMLLHALNEV